MAAERGRSPTEVGVEISSIVSQILSDLLDSSADQTQPSTSYNRAVNEGPPTVLPQPRINTEETAAERTQSNVPYQTCTVKEMLNEILDCTIIRIPSIQLPSTSTGSNRISVISSGGPPEYLLDPRTVSRQIYNVRRDSNDNAPSRMQCTVKEVLSELMDYTVFKKMERRVNVCDSIPGTSRTRSEHLEQTDNLRTYEIYRALGAGIVNSTNAIHDEIYLQKSPGLSTQKILPSYSSVIRMGPPPRSRIKNCSSCSFVPRKPPPSYAEVEGIWEDSPSLISSESAVFGPDPTYMICPRCRTAVVTEVQVHRSITTHLIALFLCLCLCWPCCLMPYCLRSCNYSHHTCPHCSYYFGMYRPF